MDFAGGPMVKTLRSFDVEDLGSITVRELDLPRGNEDPAHAATETPCSQINLKIKFCQ